MRVFRMIKVAAFPKTLSSQNKKIMDRKNDFFTTLGKSHSAPCLPATREEWENMRRSSWLKEMCRRIESGEVEMKHKLPVWTPSCAEFRDNHRAAKDALKPLARLMLDFDAKGFTEQIMNRLKDNSPLEVLLIEESVRRGTHVLVELPKNMTADEAQQLMKEATGFEPDVKVKGYDRCIYMVPEDHTKFVSEKLFEAKAIEVREERGERREEREMQKPQTSALNPQASKTFKGIPYSEIIKEYWMRMGGEPEEGERNDKLHRLAANLRAICDNSESLLLEIMPRYGLAEDEMKAIIHSACKEPTKGSRIMNSIIEVRGTRCEMREDDEEEEKLSTLNSQLSINSLPQGISESIAAVGPQLAMPVVTAVCPCIGMLATGVQLDVHGVQRGLNLISYIAGDFASGKGMIDPVIDAWMSEVMALDKMYQIQEDEWRAKKRAAKNKKEQPEEPKLPVRCLTLNNTVANLAERLANTEGKHAFSFTPEADTVAQKWKSTLSDFSVMLRQSYDGTKYEREARSADAVNVHIEKLLWNVVMCGTPDALYRVVSNYTDGFQSRIAVARTPDNTFAPLEDKPHVLTERQTERIQQVAHLLPLMYGPIVLPKLEARGRQWLENVRLETMKNDDKVMARQRFRICVTAQRMTCCLMLCKVCEQLIKKHGLNGAETQLKQNPNLWKELLVKAQTPSLLDAYDVIADSLMENALHFFRERIENAFTSREYIGCAGYERSKHGKNDSIFERLDPRFTFEQAIQQSIAVKGAGVTRNSIHQMLKNWRRQGLIVQRDECYIKLNK